MTILADDLFHGTLDTSLSGVWVQGKEANHPAPRGFLFACGTQPTTPPTHVKSLSRHKAVSEKTKKPNLFQSSTFFKYGGDRRARTFDLTDVNRAL